MRLTQATPPQGPDWRYAYHADDEVGSIEITTPSGGNLVGPAFTMRSIPAREDLDQISAFDNPDHPQRKGVESIPPGHVLVIDCRGETRVA